MSATRRLAGDHKSMNVRTFLTATALSLLGLAGPVHALSIRALSPGEAEAAAT